MTPRLGVAGVAKRRHGEAVGGGMSGDGRAALRLVRRGWRAGI